MSVLLWRNSDDILEAGLLLKVLYKTSLSSLIYVVGIFERVVEVGMDIICSLHEGISVFSDYKLFICRDDEDLYR